MKYQAVDHHNGSIGRRAVWHARVFVVDASSSVVDWYGRHDRWYRVWS